MPNLKAFVLLVRVIFGVHIYIIGAIDELLQI